MNTTGKKWRIANKEHLRRVVKKWNKNNPDKALLHSIRSRAKKLGIKFNLTVDDVIIPKRCPILGMALKKGVGRSCGTSPTVDRINSKRGYVKGNVAVISNFANVLKGAATAAQHRRIAEWMESVS